jgi:hypothetical protein
MDGRTDRQMDERTPQMDERTERQMILWIDLQTDRHMDRRTDRQMMKGQKDRRLNSLKTIICG